MTELGDFGHGGRSADITNGIPSQGRSTELPGGWMPGLCGDKNGDAGSLPIPACHGNCGHSLGGKHPHPQCTRCDMLVPRWALNGRDPATTLCARGGEQKRRRLAEEELRESSERAFKSYGELLENVTAFRYLRRVLTAGDYDWLAVLGNLGKARNSMGRLLRILIRKEADLKVSGQFYKAVS